MSEPVDVVPLLATEALTLLLAGGASERRMKKMFFPLVFIQDFLLMNANQRASSPFSSEADFFSCRAASASEIMRKEWRLVA